MKPTNEQSLGRDVARNFRQLSTEIAADLAVITSDAAALDARVIVLEGEAWTAPTLGGSWVNYGSGFRTARYRKIGDIVEIEGLVKSGTTGSTIFTLPSGYRPPQGLIMPTITDPNVFARLDVTAAGAVIVYFTGTSAYANIGCRFCTV